MSDALVPTPSEWETLSESLVRGLVHALNNRLAALSAFSELAAMGDEEFTAERVLPGEIERLQQIGVHLRLLASEREGPEAIEPGVVLDEAVAMLAHAPGLRAVRCTVERHGTLLPLRVPRWALLRLVLVVVEGGKRAAERAGRETTVLRVTGDERWMTIHADGVTISPYASAMARVCGADQDGLARQSIVRLPTLPEVRARERAARAGAPS